MINLADIIKNSGYNKKTYEEAKKNYGLKKSTWIDGEEYDYIPTNPASLLFWACDKVETPVFEKDGKFIGWKSADAETKKKYRTIVEETSKANGYSFTGLSEIFG